MAKQVPNWLPTVGAYIATASATSMLWVSGFLQSIDLQVFDLLLNQFPKTTLKNFVAWVLVVVGAIMIIRVTRDWLGL